MKLTLEVFCDITKNPNETLYICFRELEICRSVLNAQRVLFLVYGAKACQLKVSVLVNQDRHARRGRTVW